MTKFSKVYHRNKKESNISLPLRFSFLKSVFVDGMSVKNVTLFSSRPLSNGKCTTLLPKSLLELPKNHLKANCFIRHHSQVHRKRSASGDKSHKRSRLRDLKENRRKRAPLT